MNYQVMVSFCTEGSNLIIVPYKSNNEVILLYIDNHAVKYLERAEYKDVYRYLRGRIKNCALGLDGDSDVLNSAELAYLRGNRFFEVINTYGLTYKNLLSLLEGMVKYRVFALKECTLIMRSLEGPKAFRVMFIYSSSGYDLSEDFKSVAKFKKYLTEECYNQWVQLTQDEKEAILQFIDLSKEML